MGDIFQLCRVVMEKFVLVIHLQIFSLRGIRFLQGALRANTHSFGVLLEVTDGVLLGNHTVCCGNSKIAVVLSQRWSLHGWSLRLIKEALARHRLNPGLHKIESNVTRPVSHERSVRFTFLAAPAECIIELLTLNLLLPNILVVYLALVTGCVSTRGRFHLLI